MQRSTRDRGIEEACDHLAKLFDAGDKDALLGTVRELLSAALHDVDVLSARVAELLRSLYGRRSERISPDQLAWAFVSPEPTPEALPEPPPEIELPVPAPRGRRPGRRGHTSLPSYLPRQEIRLEPTEEQLANTSGKLRKWREERSEVLEYEPPRLKVLVYVREVWSSEQGEVVIAPAPVKIIPKGLPGPELLVQVVLAKFRDHCPLTRQVAIYRRLGVELSRNTLVDWVAAVAALLAPIARCIRARVMAAYVLQADDTRLPVLDRSKAKNIKRGHLWALVGDHPYVAYVYTESWRGETVFQVLGERTGWLQVDGYVGYERLFTRGQAIEVGCMMHARRYFVRAFRGRDLRAVEPLQHIRKLYAIEAASQAAGEGPEERLRRRQRDSKPHFDALKEWLAAHAGCGPPSLPLGRAITYATNQWQALCRPLEDGRLELDNGECERQMRGPAMGRRNWLFAGSDEGAERTAILCTVLTSAARHGLDLRLYLRDVLLKLAAGWPQRRLEELLPHRWRELHAEAAQAADRAAAPPLRAAL